MSTGSGWFGPQWAGPGNLIHKSRHTADTDEAGEKKASWQYSRVDSKHLDSRTALKDIYFSCSRTLRSVYLCYGELYVWQYLFCDTISTEKYSPILVLCKSHKACSYWRVVYGAPEIESDRKLAKLSIKLWQESPPHAKRRQTEDRQVPARLRDYFCQYTCKSAT